MRKGCRVSHWRTQRRLQKEKQERRARNKAVRDFWAVFYTATDKAARLRVLIEMADWNWNTRPNTDEVRRKQRARFNYDRRQIKLLGKKCQACEERPAQCRHHIVPISRGGSNHQHNIMLLCDDCHKEIHPWMKIVLDTQPLRFIISA